MNNHITYKIGNLCKVNAKSIGRGSSSHFILYLETSAVTNGVFEKPVELAINESPSRAKRIVRDNDILISTVRPNLKHFGFVKKAQSNLIASTGFAVLSPYLEKVDPKFLYYYISTDGFTNYLTSIAEGQTSTYPAFNPDVIEKSVIQFPPPKEQQKISSVLSAYDYLIENNNKRIALLEHMAEQIYKEWFVRMRFPGYENAEFEKGVPKGWEVEALNSIANILMGQSPKSEFYNTNGMGLPFHQGVGTYGKRFPSHEVFCSTNGRRAKEGDILFSVRAPVGRINIADQKLIIGRGLAAVNHKRGFQSYLFYLLNYYFQLEDVIGNGSIFNSVGKIELNKFKILQPAFEFEKKFNEVVSPIDKQILLLFQKNIILKQTRDLLLPRLINGKLRVKIGEREFGATQ